MREDVSAAKTVLLRCVRTVSAGARRQNSGGVERDDARHVCRRAAPAGARRNTARPLRKMRSSCWRDGRRSEALVAGPPGRREQDQPVTWEDYAHVESMGAFCSNSTRPPSRRAGLSKPSGLQEILLDTFGRRRAASTIPARPRGTDPAPRNVQDSARPSGSAMIAYNRCGGRLYAETRYENAAAECLRALGGATERVPEAWRDADRLDLYLRARWRSRSSSDPADERTQAMLRVVTRALTAPAVVALFTQDADSNAMPALLRSRTPCATGARRRMCARTSCAPPRSLTARRSRRCSAVPDPGRMSTASPDDQPGRMRCSSICSSSRAQAPDLGLGLPSRKNRHLACNILVPKDIIELRPPP